MNSRDELEAKAAEIGEAAALLQGAAQTMPKAEIRNHLGTILHNANELDDLFPDPHEP